MRQYISLIHKDPDSDFSVSFPDIPGCVTAGRTLDEAREMAGDALALHIEGMIDGGEVIPDPSSLETILQDSENGARAFMIVRAARTREAA